MTVLQFPGTATSPVNTVTLEAACAAIVRESSRRGLRCSTDDAMMAVCWLEGILTKARRSPGNVYFPMRKEMRGLSYTLINAVMPHGQQSRPGTAHALLEDYLLDRTDGESRILHDDREWPTNTGTRARCAYEVRIAVLH